MDLCVSYEPCFHLFMEVFQDVKLVFFYGSHDLMHLLPARYRDPTDDGTDFMEDNLSMDAEILIGTFNCYHLVM